ncbi:hypothetical protein [Mucilaginibacter sp.]
MEVKCDGNFSSDRKDIQELSNNLKETTYGPGIALLPRSILAVTAAAAGMDGMNS